MNMEKGQDWKWQVIDKVIEFIQAVDPGGEEASDLLLEDEGQLHLAWDAMRPLFPTNRFKPGDALTAIELGRLFGHWRSLWIVLTISEVLRTRLAESYLAVTEIRDKIDSILTEHMPEAKQGIQTGVLHLLSVTSDPSLIDAIRNHDKEFEALALSVREMSYVQNAVERENFMKGYGQALSCAPLDESGEIKTPNKLAQLLMFCRPFAIRAGLAACDFQEGIDFFAGARITGNPEGFSKHLQRRKASLRSKGRPAKKAGKAKASRKKKSDNL